jgi:hypothetical protein
LLPCKLTECSMQEDRKNYEPPIYKTLRKSVVILLSGFLLSSTTYSQNWVRTMGGTGQQRGAAITIDGVGNSYTIGNFAGTIDFDPGAGVFNLTALSYDVFVLKLDASGDFVWAKKWGGAAGADGVSIQVDAMGNIYR